MPQRIEVPGVGVVEFPDGMSDAQIAAAIQANMQPADNRPPAQRFVQNVVAGLVRGAGSIGATLLAPHDALNDAAMRAAGGRPAGPSANQQRRQAMDGALRDMGVDTQSLAFGGGKLAGELAGTAGMGGVLAAPLAGATRAAPVVEAIRTAGMSAGGLTGRAGMAARAAGGAITGGASAALVNPQDALTGAAVGAAAPGVLQGLGAAGRAVGRLSRGELGRTDPAVLLSRALGTSDAEVADLLAKARTAPAEIVPGSRLTLAQALQQQGAGNPTVNLLERMAAGGPGGDELLQRYAAQAEARMNALRAAGAQTYQGAAAEEATKSGDLIGAILRTQAADEKGAARAAWEQVYRRAADDGAQLTLPLDDMQRAMGALGPGTVGAGADARAILAEANKIGTVQVGGVKATTDAASAQPLTLAQAVRRAGGISKVRNDGLGGEIKGIGEELKNLVRKNGGLTPGRMAEKMHEAGYIADDGIDTLLDALRADARGTPQFSSFDMPERSWAAARDAAMGDPPPAEAIPVPVPFDQFQRLWRSAGALGAKLSDRAGGEVEAGVMRELRGALAQRVDDAAGGALGSGEVMSPEFARQYLAARDMTRQIGERYKGGNNIAAILRRPVGQNYTLAGDEVFRKLWHGGQGLEADVVNLKQTLAPQNLDPAMRSLQQAVMTEAASKTTAAGNLGAGLPRYVETRMPGLQEAMTPDQLKTLQSVAADIRNAEAAGSVAGLRGSDTQAKIARALDAGLIDGPLLRTLSRVLTIKGVGLDWLRGKVAEAVARDKNQALVQLLLDPRSATAGAAGGAGSAPGLLQSLAAQQAARLGLLSAPILATDQ